MSTGGFPLDVNAVVGGYLRDLAFVQPSRQQMFGYKRAADAILALETPLTTLLDADGTLAEDRRHRPGLEPRDPRSARDRRLADRRTGGRRTAARRAEIERRRGLRRHFLSRAEVLRMLRDPSYRGTALEDYRGDLQMHSEWSDGSTDARRHRRGLPGARLQLRRGHRSLAWA